MRFVIRGMVEGMGMAVVLLALAVYARTLHPVAAVVVVVAFAAGVAIGAWCCATLTAAGRPEPRQ